MPIPTAEMQEAVATRRRLRHNLPKSLCGSSTSAAKSISLRHIQSEWESFRPLQSSYLDVEVSIVRLAVLGEPIHDFAKRSKRQSPSPARDIAYELEQLFPVVAARPTHRLREVLNKPTISQSKAAWARNTIIAMLRAPLAALFDMADVLAMETLKHVGRRTDERLHVAFTRVLMYLSDCWRYTLDHTAAKSAAQLLQILSPGDPQAHLRLGMNLAMLGNGNDAIRPFFHYCVFLANRKVDVGHSEAGVVSNFVKSRRPASKTGIEEKDGNVSGRRACFSSLIDTLWSLLSEDFDKAEQKVRQTQLWDLFEKWIQEGFSANDMMDIIGSVIFAHYRCSPRGSPDGKLLPHCELADEIVCKLIHVVSSHIAQSLKALYTELQKRKRNRRRAMQKKKRNDSFAVDRDTIIGHQIFLEKVDLDTVTPALGGISFLAHYWSKARSAPSPATDLKPLGRTLKVLQDVKRELEEIEKLTCTAPLATHIETKILEGLTGHIPAMPEDLRFCHFLPCQEYNMFHQTSLQKVPLRSILQQSEEGIVKLALKRLGDQSYESLLVKTTTLRHLEAFSKKAANDVATALGIPRLHDQAACTLVCMTIQKCRIRRLVRDLEKVGGGHLVRMSLESSCDPDRKEALINQQEHDALPSPGQPRSSITDHEDSFHEPISPGELGAQVRKRRRILGICTAPVAHSSMPGSQSNHSSADRRSHGDRLTQERPPSREHKGAEVPSPIVGQKRTREQRRARSTYLGNQRHGGILSQGSLQLSYVQPAQPREQQASTNGKPNMRCTELYLRLRNFLYPPDAEPQTDADGRAWWRGPPSEDLPQNIFLSNPLSSDA